MNEDMNEELSFREKAGLVGILVAAVFGVLLVFSSFESVGNGEEAVMVRFGEVVGTLPSGFHWTNPMNDIVTFDIKNETTTVDSSAASKDLQSVSSKIAVINSINATLVTTVYKSYGTEIRERLLYPSIQEAVKAATAKYTAEELVTKRPEVSDAIKQNLTERIGNSGITVQDINIIDFDFSEQFNKAIESKVQAEQDALTQKNKLEQVKYEAEQRVTQAKAEAEAIKIQAEAIQSQGGAAYVQLKAIEKWGGQVPQYMMGNSVPFVQLK